LIRHARHPQEVRIQSRTRRDVAPNYFNRTRGSRRGESPTRCTEEKRKSREREHKKTKKATACEKKKKEKAKDNEPKKNTCPHCKKYHRKKPHRMWNKKYKGYNFKSICDELEVDFKPRIKFSADLGGYAKKDDSGGE